MKDIDDWGVVIVVTLVLIASIVVLFTLGYVIFTTLNIH
jgi:hypothetical protein